MTDTTTLAKASTLAEASVFGIVAPTIVEARSQAAREVRERRAIESAEKRARRFAERARRHEEHLARTSIVTVRQVPEEERDRRGLKPKVIEAAPAPTIIRRRRDPVVGRKWNDLTVIEDGPDLAAGSRMAKRQVWCRCRCGNILLVLLSSVKSGNTKSCGHRGKGQGHTPRDMTARYEAWKAKQGDA